MHYHHPYPPSIDSESSVAPEWAPPRNFLFVVPDALDELEREILEATVTKMVRHGYVYVADAAQLTIEDRDGVRYLPFRGGSLPSFGALASVIVLHDASVADLAKNLYPCARHFLVNSTLEPEARGCTEGRARSRDLVEALAIQPATTFLN